MSNILVALAYIHCRSKCRNTINKLLFAFWFNLSSQIFFNLMPRTFNRIQIGGFRWSSPPVYAHFFKESLGIPRAVFRIVILHKPVRGWRQKSCFNERKKGFTKDFAVQCSIHLSFKHACSSGSFLTNSHPNMYLHWMLRSWFWSWLHAFFSATRTMVSFKLYASFVTPYDIINYIGLFCSLGHSRRFCLFTLRIS